MERLISLDYAPAGLGPEHARGSPVHENTEPEATRRAAKGKRRAIDADDVLHDTAGDPTAPVRL